MDPKWTLTYENTDARNGVLTLGEVEVEVQIEGEDADWTLEMWNQPPKKWLFRPRPKSMHFGRYPSKEAAFQDAKRIVQEMSN